jgi:hypothetical protein
MISGAAALQLVNASKHISEAAFELVRQTRNGAETKTVVSYSTRKNDPVNM